MNHFNFKNGHLYCENIPVKDIAEKIGTPTYVYSSATINNNLELFDEAFKDYPHLFCYSMKANSNLSILAITAKKGWGIDIVSGGELFRALKAGVDPKKIVYAGVGKTSKELKEAIDADILLINIESEAELEAIDKIGKQSEKEVSVALRINPEIELETHHNIATGKKGTKFGLSFIRAKEIFLKRANYKNIQIEGLHMHIGSQIISLKPYEEAVRKMVEFIEELKKEGVPIQWLNIGGGMGITYKEEIPPTPSQLADAILPLIEKTGCKLIIEPGRFIVGNAGILITKVLYTKISEDRNFIIVDAGMNSLVRVALYGAYHEILSEEQKDGTIVADVVGPICENTDFFAKNRELPPFKQGDYLIIMSTGAFSFSMSSNYNSHTRPAEVLIDNSRGYLIKRRESYLDLIQGESISPRLVLPSSLESVDFKTG